MAVPLTLSSVPAQTPYVQYVASSSQTVFPYPFEITQDSDLVCLINGVAQPTDGGYTLSGQGNTNGGNLTFTLGQTAGTIITLYRNISISRITQLSQNGTFFSANFNNEFNKIYLIMQQLQQSLQPGGNTAYALMVPIGNSPTPTTLLTPANYANKYLAFDANGNPTPAVLTSSGSLTRSIISGLLGYVQDNVLLHGADPTGAADSLSFFNAATAANTDFVLVPPGVYKLTAATNPGMWQVSSGASFTGSGYLVGKTVQEVNNAGAYAFRVLDNGTTSPNQKISFNIESGLYQTGTVSALQFGQATELFTPSTSSAVWTGQLTGVYGSTSHFGSGNVNDLFGGSFEAFNDGPATATLVVGVNGNAWNGGVVAGSPAQTPTNNGVASNLRGVSGFASNLSTGTVTNAVALYGNTITNTGGGAVTNAYGLFLSDQTAGTNNYGVFAGLGLHSFGDVVKIAGRTALPASTGGVFMLAQGTGSPSSGRIYFGDGSGYLLEFTKRTGSADTVVAYLSDAGQMSLNGALGWNGASPPAQVTGFGSPVGGEVVASYNITDAGGANSNTNKCVAEILTILKAHGMIGA